jgi:hypothetical protein
MTLEVGETALQLDELRLAEGSPASAAVEDHQGAPASSGLMQMDRLAVLVGQHNIREARANSRANVAEVNTEIRHGRHSFPSAQGWNG